VIQGLAEVKHKSLCGVAGRGCKVGGEEREKAVGGGEFKPGD